MWPSRSCAFFSGSRRHCPFPQIAGEHLVFGRRHNWRSCCICEHQHVTCYPCSFSYRFGGQPSKSDMININSSNFNNDVSLIRSVLQNVSVAEHVDLSILGSQINPASCRLKLDIAVVQFDLMSSLLAKVDAHNAFFLLGNCFPTPRLLFTLCSSPRYQHTDKLAAFHNGLKMAASTMWNIQ